MYVKSTFSFVRNLQTVFQSACTILKTKQKRMKRNEDSLRDLWDNIKRNNVRIIGVPEGDKREKGEKKEWQNPKIDEDRKSVV